MDASFWQELGVQEGLHNELIEVMKNTHEQIFKSQQNRPSEMAYFDEAFHDLHGRRVKQLYDFRKAGGKSIGTFCIYIPDEIALAVGVEPFSLCGGTSWSLNYADKVLPRDICPLIRSTFGMAVSGTCPYKKLKDFAIGETTCDAKKKTWDLFGIEALELPQKKTSIDKDLWYSEVKRFQMMMESLSGRTITYENLKNAIEKVNRKRLLLQQINEFRTAQMPPISGLDALLVSQIALNHDLDEFISAASRLVENLNERLSQGISAYSHPCPRIMIAGTPSPAGYAKIHHIIESSGMMIVADESCTGMRYYKENVDASGTDVDNLIHAVSERYMKIDCPCFSPNSERIDSIVKTIEHFHVHAVVQSILMYCHGFNIEAKAIEKKLNNLHLPSIILSSDYSDEDKEQLKVRLESLREII